MGRSRMISDEIKSNMKSGQASAKDNLKAASVGLQDFRCCVIAPPPKLPLLSFENYLESYWKTVEVFTRNEAEREIPRKAVDEFSAPGSLGAQMYAGLMERANDPNIECWLSDTKINSPFLHFRHPLAPWNAFVHTHHDSPSPNSQATRAALLTKVAFQLLRSMEAINVENDCLGSRQL